MSSHSRTARPCSANRAQAPSSLFSFPAHESGTYDVITLRITGCAKLEQVQVDRPHVPCASSLSLVALELISARFNAPKQVHDHPSCCPPFSHNCHPQPRLSPRSVNLSTPGADLTLFPTVYRLRTRDLLQSPPIPYLVTLPTELPHQAPSRHRLAIPGWSVRSPPESGASSSA